jgi:hypothetical protein
MADMKRLLKYIALIPCLSMAFNACDVLDKLPTDKYSEDVVWGSENAVDSYVVGFYAFLKDATEIAHSNMTNFTDAYTDIFKSSSWDQHNHTYNRVLLQETMFSETNAGSFECWNDCYSEIKQDNEFLRDAPKYIDRFGEEFINTRMAEIRVVRAYAYFKLMRVYGYNDTKYSAIENGGVVLRTSLDGPAENDKPRTSWTESWNFIIDELYDAAEALPVTWGGTKRLTKAAAYALLTRIGLYAERWDVVIDAAQKCEELGCVLADDYAKIFRDSSNPEHIFAVDFLANKMTHRADMFFRPIGDSKYHSDNTIFGALCPTSELVDSYEMADGTDFSWDVHGQTPYLGREPRFYASVLYNRARWEGREIQTYEGGTDGIGKFQTNGTAGTTTTGYYFKKFITENDFTWETNGSSHFATFIRYAEVLLNYAEALAEQDWAANGAEALAALNKVRARVSLPEKTASSLEEFRTILRKERMVELAGEGFRYWDIRRWRIGEEVIHGKQAHGCRITETQGGEIYTTYEQIPIDAGMERIFLERYYSFSIPIVERSNNRALGANNPGW